MRINLVGAFIRNDPFGTEIAFKKGLQRLGVQVTTFDPSYTHQKLDRNADATIVFKWIEPTMHAEISECSGKKIVYQVDDLRFPHIKQMMQEMRKICDSAFTFDQDGADLALSYGFKKARRLLLTADNMLYRYKPGTHKDIDFCFVGSLTAGSNHASRNRMIQVLNEQRKYRIAFASEIFDIGSICEIYNRSKVVLNHATDVGQPFGHGFGYQCRHFEAGFTKACILSNKVDNDSALQNFETFSSESELIEKAAQLISDKARRETLASCFYEELYSKHLPEHRAQEMLDFIGEL